MDTKHVFNVPLYENATPENQLIFDQLRKSLGIIPNLYATISYSSNGLNSYMAYVQAQAKGTFHAKDREAIFLIVSELNGCRYCLSSHTVGALKNHWTIEETKLLRSGKMAGAKWEAIYAVIESVIENKGEVSDEHLDAFFAAGYDNGALIDLVILINVMTLTNHVYRMTKIPIDFPLAEPIHGEFSE